MKRWPLCIGLVSAAALGFEVQLLRVLGIQHWHQFAATIIGLALLGYAAAGTAISLGEQRRQFPSPEGVFRAVLMLAVAMPAMLSLAQFLPFNGLELVWDPRQLIWLGALMLLLAVPFVAAGWAIVCAFRLRSEAIGGIYAGDLLGAGLGATLSALVLSGWPPASAVATCSLLALLAAFAMPGEGRTRWVPGVLTIVLISGLWWLGLPSVRISPFKGQSQMSSIAGARLLDERFTRHGYLAVIDNDRMPIRFVPGLSLQTGIEPPRQLALFRDGDDMIPMTANSEDSRHWSESVSAAAWSMLDTPRVLTVDSGTGTSVQRALGLGSLEILAAEPIRLVVDLVEGQYAERSGSPYSEPGVELIVSDSRRALRRAGGPVDLVVLSASTSLASSAAGVGALRANYGLTREAWMSALDRVEQMGWVSWSGWVQLPPRRVLKLVATIREALDQRGVKNPARHLAVIRDWNTATVLVSKAPIDKDQILRLHEFSAARGFDLVWLPGLDRDQANRRFRWREPFLYDGIVALLGSDAAGFSGTYPFDLRPSEDDRPYPFHTFRFGLLDVLGQNRAASVLLESGYLVQTGTLILAVTFGLPLLIVPILATRRTLKPFSGTIALFFVSIGLGFLLLEVALIERASLWLGQAADAFALVLAAVLIGAGGGSAINRRLQHRWGEAGVLLRALALKIMMIGLLIGFPGEIDDLMLSSSPLLAGAMVFVMAGILGVALGQYFPLGLDRVAEHHPHALPWAWANNGVASVVGAASAPLIAADLGLRALLLIAMICYVIAVMVHRRWQAF